MIQNNNDIDLPSMNDVSHSITSGLVIILVKGSRCPPCISLMNYLNSAGKPWKEVLQAIQAEYAETQVQFVYADVYNDEIPCLQEARVRSIPTIMIINNGKLVKSFNVNQPYTIDSLVNAIKT